jgi:hypothetical protein
MLRFYPLAALALVLAGAPVYAQALDVATGPAATHLRSETDKPAATSMASSRLVALYDNGPLVTATGVGAGGADVSQLQTLLGLTTLGTNHNSAAASPFFLADDFTVPEGGWTIDDIEFFAYQTGAGTGTSTFTSMFVQIWNGPPNDAASTVVWGDLEANVLASSAFTNIYRTADNVADPSTATTRPIFRNTATIGTTLPAGTYWVQWGAAGSLASGPWGPAVTLPGAIAPGNALLFSAGAWIASIDGGTAQAPQDFPFVINGTGSGSGTVTTDMPAGTLAGGPIWGRPLDLGNGTSGSCGLSGVGSAVAYATLPMTVSTAGAYTLTALWDQFDGYLFVYRNAFNPTDQCLNLVALNDDGPAGISESLIADAALEAGEYVVVLSGFGASDAGPYTGTVVGPAGVTFPTVAVEEGVGSIGGSLSASPNPLRGSSVVRLSVETPQEVSVAVYDMTGRKAASLFEGSVVSGQTVEFDLDASALPSGVYVVRATGATVSLAQRVTVLR